MSHQIIESLKAVKGKLKWHKHTFELVGYDFMVVCDEFNNFATRVIEVNTNPALDEPNETLKSYLPRMVNDMFKIVLDPLFCPNITYKKNS